MLNIKFLLFRAQQERNQMDRCRFEAAHLKYAALCLAVRYPEAFHQRGVTVDVEVRDMLQEITPSLYDAFQAKYAGLHTPMYVRNEYLKNVYKGNYLLVCLQINIVKTRSQVSQYVSLDC